MGRQGRQGRKRVKLVTLSLSKSKAGYSVWGTEPVEGDAVLLGISTWSAGEALAHAASTLAYAMDDLCALASEHGVTLERVEWLGAEWPPANPTKEGVH